MDHKSSRRNFIKYSSFGLGGIVISHAGNAQHKPAFIKIPSSKPDKLKVVCVGAHPGDPEFGCGGTMARYSDAGHEVIFLYLTRGEAYDAEQSHAESAALRTREAEISCKALNAKPMFAGQIDGSTILNNEKNLEFHNMISSLKPDLVFTHWPVDTHMDHQIAGLLTLSSWNAMNKSFELYFYEVNSGNETMEFNPTDYVDITKEQEKKKAAMFAHKTQDPVNTYNTFFQQMESFRGLEAGVKAAEAFIHFKSNTKRAALLLQ
jgi:LmbE family N-acetylglucosaminyl deacetylase